LEARVRSPEVSFGELRAARYPASQEAATERAVREEGDTELAARPQQSAFGVARPQRIFALHGADRMRGVRTPQRGRRDFAQADRPDTAFLDETGERAHRLFDGRIGRDPVHVVEIDALDAEPLQRSLAGG